MLKQLLRRSAVCLLIFSMILSLAACGGSDTTGTSDADQSDTGSLNDPENPTISDPFPKALEELRGTMTDTELHFYYVEGGSGTYTGDSIWIDSDIGTVDDVEIAIINRNHLIEEDLGVKIVQPVESLEGIQSLRDFTKSIFDAQSDELDVYCGYQYYDIGFAADTTGGAKLVNLNTIVNANGMKIIDITRPYWATNYINSITYNNAMYWVTGDLALRYLGGLYCTFVNTTIYNTSCRSAYDNKSIYRIVNDKQWTLQTMLDMATLAWRDTDDSGAASEADDTVGIVYEPMDCMDALAFGAKIDFSTKRINPDGSESIELSFLTSKRALSLSDIIARLFSSKANLNAGASMNDSAQMMTVFSNGNALFAVNKIFQAVEFLSEMDDYAIIPLPMLDDSQDTYASGVHDGVTIFGISKYSSKKIEAAATLELMAYYSHALVAPVYYEKVIKGGRTVRDEEAPAMIDIIRAGFNSDFVCAWSHQIGDIVHTFRSPSNVGSSFAAYQKISNGKWKNGLKSLLEKLDENAKES